MMVLRPIESKRMPLSAMRSTFLRACLVLTVLFGNRSGLAADQTSSTQSRPAAPAEAAGRLSLPPGFRATLFAAEPDVVQPIAFTIDPKGRLWVVECYSYPLWLGGPNGRDRILIFEDTDGDEIGRAHV